MLSLPPTGSLQRLLLSALLLALGLLLGPLASSNARAATTYCRTDPVATLSNGAQVTMYADVYDTDSDVQNANFVLHVPAGVSVTDVSYDPTYGYLESFSWVADQNPGFYRINTLVTTATSGIKVAATVAVDGMICNLPSKSTQGQSGKDLWTVFNC